MNYILWKDEIMQWTELMKDKAFITDIGTTCNVEIEGKKTDMGRYAVWSPVTNSKNHQIIEVGDNLDELSSKYNIPPDRICTLITEQKD